MSSAGKNAKPITTDELLFEIIQRRLLPGTLVPIGVNANGTVVTIETPPLVKNRRIVKLGEVKAYTVTDLPVQAGSGSVDVTDRVGRLLGVIASITAAVDVSDRAARQLGILASVTAAVDVSDRAARLLGVIASITAPVIVGSNTGFSSGTVAIGTASTAIRTTAQMAGKSAMVVTNLDGAAQIMVGPDPMNPPLTQAVILMPGTTNPLSRYTFRPAPKDAISGVGSQGAGTVTLAWANW